MSLQALTRQVSEVRTAVPDLYRAVWRWHFYAGLLVLPFMITLAVTGALYLFDDQIEAIIYSDIKRVEVQPVAPLSAGQIVAAALSFQPGTAVTFTDPPAPDASAEVTVVAPSGERMAVNVDPYDGDVLGVRPDQSTLMWTVRQLHSLSLFGPVASGIIEIVGGWTILLVASGIYLWWPRGQGGGVVSVRGTPRRRVFWRDLHAVTGLVVGGFVLFLAVTGMPWSGVWGGKVNEWANGRNFGYPAGVRVEVPMSEARLNDTAPTVWSLEQAQIPESAASAATATPIGLDAAVATFEGLGLHRGYAVSLPASETGVYSASVYPDDLQQQRVVHLDQYSGKVLVDMSYADYGPLGRWLEFGINTHMGQQFGLANKLLFLVVCAGIVLLAVSAAVMWWKRRPARTFGVPPMPADRRVFRGVIAILVVGGILFPLTGLSLIAMLTLDWLGRRVFARPVAA